MPKFVLDFEKPIVELEKRIQDMKEFGASSNIEVSSEIESLEKKLGKLQKEIYSHLTRWQRVQLARHPDRPYSMDYIKMMSEDFVELHGDRLFRDDKAIIGGLARFGGRPCMFIGHQKGRGTKENLYRNFGMPHPEGYRKALRLMGMAAKFKRPVISLVDTPGAYPGIGAEERGQAEAIARNLKEMSRLPVPIIISIVGEGASGGALGIGVGDVVLMLENSWYSVISPEGCAAILWRDRAQAPQAAEALKVASGDLMSLRVIDKIVPEPLGGAHRDPTQAAKILKAEISRELNRLTRLSPEVLIKRRLEKFRSMGVFSE